MSTSTALQTELSASISISHNGEYLIFKLTAPLEIRVFFENLAKANRWIGSYAGKESNGPLKVGYTIGQPKYGKLADEIEKIKLFCANHRVSLSDQHEKMPTFDNSND